MFHKRAVVAEINLSNIEHNLKLVRSLLKKGTKLMPVIKANAYGHGTGPIAKACEKAKPDYLAVACIYEVSKIRDAGVNLPVLNLGPMLPNEAEAVIQYNYAPTVFNLETVKALSKVAVSKKTNIKIHIKVDTGMRRIGLQPDEVPSFIKEVKKLPRIEIEGLYTHFANSDEKERECTLIQLGRFNEVLKNLKKLGVKIPLIHSANSGGILYFPESHYDVVRPGTLTFGFAPNPEMPVQINLKPLMTLKTYVVHVKTVPAQTPISYGWTYVTRQETKVASLPLGYADGFRRAPNNWKYVLVNGKRAPILGRVCMDQSMIDVTGIPDVKLGTEVVLMGKQGKEKIDMWDVAEKSGTIAHEVMVQIGERVTRVYTE